MHKSLLVVLAVALLLPLLLPGAAAGSDVMFTTFEGRVTEKLVDRFTVATVHPGSTDTTPVTFYISDSTVYMQNALPVTYDQVAAGAYVRVHANEQEDSTWLASKVVIVKPPRVEFMGVVVAKGSADFTIENADGQVTFLVDSATIFLNDCGLPAAFEDIAIGERVRVMAISVPTAGSEMVWLAKKVCILPPPVVTFQGVVLSKDADSFEIRSAGTVLEFAVDDSTVFVEYLQEVDFAALEVGDRVRVRAIQQTDDTWLARRVVILPAQITVRGIVTSKAETQFSLRSAGQSYTFTVTASTFFVKTGFAEPTYADMVVGDTAVVTATQQADGAWVATRVKIIVLPY